MSDEKVCGANDFNAERCRSEATTTTEEYGYCGYHWSQFKTYHKGGVK